MKRLGLLVSSILSSACGLLMNYDDYQAEPSVANATSAVSSSGSAGHGSGGEGGTAPACPTGKGATMVRVDTPAGSYCIDSTEATVEQYNEFLDDPAVGPQPAACAWNANSYTPTQPNGDSDLPVIGVDWCDAWAFCEWAGKRMCGKIGGGPVAFDQFAAATESQWYAACSAGGSLLFPYGNNFDGRLCNGADYPGEGLIPANTTSCEGGYPGIYNMSGNAWEWENCCDGNTGEMDNCFLRSGEFSNPEPFLRCDYGGFAYLRNFTSNTIGIRCCGP